MVTENTLAHPPRAYDRIHPLRVDRSAQHRIRVAHVLAQRARLDGHKEVRIPSPRLSRTAANTHLTASC